MLDAPADTPLSEVEVNADGMLVIWASASGRTLFTIDGIAQDTGSREIALPSELFAMPVKRFVGITFGSAWNSSRRIGFETAKSSPGGGGSF